MASRAACVTMPGGASQGLASNAEDYSNALIHAIDVAAELGAPVVNHYCHYLPLREMDSNPERVRRYWDSAIEKAERTGISLALENEPFDATSTPEGMLQVLERVGSMRFGTNYDACNYHHAGEEGYPYAYDVLKKWIRYVHLKNGCIYHPEAGHLEASKGIPFFGARSHKHIYYTPVGEGALSIDALLLRLENDGYSGYCTLEPHTAPDLIDLYYAAEVVYLRRRGFFTETEKSKKGAES
jgi:sugar phosphate isomerase/epimerase